MFLPQSDHIDWYYFTGSYALDEYFSIELRHLQPIKDRLTLTTPENTLGVINLTCGSDYSGDIVTYSNYRYIKDLLATGNLPEKEVKTLEGSFDSYGIAVTLEGYKNGLITELLAMLNNYRCLNEPTLLQVEKELFKENWHSWLYSDFAKAICEELTVDLDTRDNPDLLPLFDYLKEKTNTELIWGTGCNLSIWFDRLVQPLDYTMLGKYNLNYIELDK